MKRKVTDTQQQPQESLKPCPFCGGEARIEHIAPHDHHFIVRLSFPGTYYAECIPCDFRLFGDSVALAAAAWNRRVVRPAPAEGVREALIELHDAVVLNRGLPVSKVKIAQLDKAMREAEAALAQPHHPTLDDHGKDEPQQRGKDETGLSKLARIDQELGLYPSVAVAEPAAVVAKPEVEFEVVGFAQRDLLTGDMKLLGYTRTEPTRLFAIKESSGLAAVVQEGAG